jgi:hypothetical protein
MMRIATVEFARHSSSGGKLNDLLNFKVSGIMQDSKCSWTSERTIFVDRSRELRAMRQHMHVSGYGRDYAMCQIQNHVAAKAQL